MCYRMAKKCTRVKIYLSSKSAEGNIQRILSHYERIAIGDTHKALKEYLEATCSKLNFKIEMWWELQ